MTNCTVTVPNFSTLHLAKTRYKMKYIVHCVKKDYHL